MKLTDPEIKAAKPKEKPYSLPDGRGLVLYVQPNGAKWWRYRYRFNGTAKMLSIGVYPDVTLKEARNQQTRFKELLGQGVDPSIDRKLNKQKAKAATSNSFESVARLWWKKWSTGRTSRHAEYTIRRMESDIFPIIGHRPITEISAHDLVHSVKNLEARGCVVSASRLFANLNQIFRFAVGHGFCLRNPAADVRSGDVLRLPKKTHYPRLSAQELPELLRRIDGYGGSIITRLALQMASLVFVRSSELLGARWSEFDFDRAVWIIPSERMKLRTQHTVPLSTQVISILDRLKVISGGDELVFPGARSGKARYGAFLLQAIANLGYHKRMTIHGFRGIASTILHEKGFSHDLIETQLGHLTGSEVSRAYNAALYLEPRAKMMQWWADFLDELKTSE